MKELHFDRTDNLYNSLRKLHTISLLKLKSANRNISKKDSCNSSRNSLLLSIHCSVPWCLWTNSRMS